MHVGRHWQEPAVGRLASSSLGVDTSAASEGRRGTVTDTSRSSTREPEPHHSDRISVPASEHHMRLAAVLSDRILGVLARGDTGLAGPEAAAAAANTVERELASHHPSPFALGSTRLPCSSPSFGFVRTRALGVLEEEASVALMTLRTWSAYGPSAPSGGAATRRSWCAIGRGLGRRRRCWRMRHLAEGGVDRIPVASSEEAFCLAGSRPWLWLVVRMARVRGRVRKARAEKSCYQHSPGCPSEVAVQ